MIQFYYFIEIKKKNSGTSILEKFTKRLCDNFKNIESFY